MLCASRRGGELNEQLADFKQYFIGPRGGERELENTLRTELRSALGVAGDETHEVLGIDDGGFSKAEMQFAALAVDLRNADPLSLETQL